MATVRLLLSAFCLIGFLSVRLSAKEWRGITPLHSTRTDVESLFGKASDLGRDSVNYQTDEFAVTILFASGQPCGLTANNEWRVPKDTVISITVSPKTIILFSTLRIEESKYQKLPDPHMLNRFEYWNRMEGESISVVNGEVSSFSYFAAAKDFLLRCPTSKPPEPDSTREHYTRLDTYGNLRFRDEKARLDNFAIWLQQQPKATGFIIVYPASRASLSNALARSKRAENYLVNVRRIDSRRLVRIRGGFRKHCTVELFIVPRGVEAPSPLPPLGAHNAP